jgi:hypothetical protein
MIPHIKMILVCFFCDVHSIYTTGFRAVNSVDSTVYNTIFDVFVM